MQSVMQHGFATVPAFNGPRSRFDLSAGKKDTVVAGYLTPCFRQVVIPGDTHTVKPSIFMRLLSQLKTPIMDNISVDMHFFWVPYRLVWDHFVNMVGEQDDLLPNQVTDYTFPALTGDEGDSWEGTPGDIYDHMGIPPGIEYENGTINACFLRAYNRIYNEHYRDENLMPIVYTKRDDTDDAFDSYMLLLRGKRKDFFTSCLPWPQKGTEVTIPLGTSAPVFGNGKALGVTDGYRYGPLVSNNDVGSSLTGIGQQDGDPYGTAVSSYSQQIRGSYTVGVQTKADLGSNPNYSGLYADLTSASAATINDLREMIQLQVLLERDARGGTRYPEILKAHYDIDIPDGMCERTEYLGGLTFDININPVLQTAPVSSADPTGVGKMTANATGGSFHDGFTRSFMEHGMILGIISTRMDLTYSQGIEDDWYMTDRYDLHWPEFNNLGEEPVYNRELFVQDYDALLVDGSNANTGIFGFQERYFRHKCKISQLSSEFRVDHATSLSSWHLSEDFATLPVLGETFITDQSGQVGGCLERVQVVTAGPDFFYDCRFQHTAARALPVFSIPGRTGL